ncbi:MAG: hypothetical protein FWG34_12820 [Oscillospiraceae bacterium]|nr:hypothetical protein [Oscillospiraceae bacterium]
MKKFIALILAAMVIAALAMPALAHSDNDNLGSVPKTATAPVIDGVKDPIYDEGLFVPVKNIHSGDGGLGGGANAWLLWEDNYLYVFAQMDVASFYLDEVDEWQMEQPWMLTTFEIIIDFANAGGGHEAVSMIRSDLTGFLTMHAASQDRLASGDECKKYLEFGYAKGSNYFTMEYKINMVEFRKAAEAEGLNFGSDFAAGKEIGLYLFSQECAEDGSQALYVSVPSERQGNWVPDNYDYIVLGDNVVGAPEPEPEPEPDVPAAVPAEPAPAAPEPAAPAPAAPATGDGALWLAVLAIAASGILLAAKKRAMF